jgi:hypothetical protein
MYEKTHPVQYPVPRWHHPVWRCSPLVSSRHSLGASRLHHPERWFSVCVLCCCSVLLLPVGTVWELCAGVITEHWVDVMVLCAASTTLAPLGTTSQSACLEPAQSGDFAPEPSPSNGLASVSSRSFSVLQDSSRNWQTLGFGQKLLLARMHFGDLLQ